jgi:hypothetical protein
MALSISVPHALSLSLARALVLVESSDRRNRELSLQLSLALSTPRRSPASLLSLPPTVLQRFRPITLERPKVLVPLVNVPLIEYTLEFLASNGVEVSLKTPSPSNSLTRCPTPKTWSLHPQLSTLNLNPAPYTIHPTP